jgi:iron(III) transport system ATP-binding protein
MIAGLEQPTAGSISVDDRVLDSVDRGVFVPPERREMGMIFQSYALWPHMTIRQNTEYGLRLRKVAHAERRRRADEVLAVMGIDRYADRYPSQLSGGQQQRVALARMLAVNPSVMLLDEPLSNLDSRLRLEMRAELKRIHHDFGSTIVFVTHDQWEAMTLATRIAVMFEGRLQQIGSPTDIYDRPRNRFVAEFLGNPPINVVEVVDAPSAPHVATAYEFAKARTRGTGDAPGSVGFRPESIRIEGPGEPPAGEGLTIDATVFAVLATGGSWTVEVVTDDRHLFATTSVTPTCRPGDRIRMRVGSNDVHVFNLEGDRVDTS